MHLHQAASALGVQLVGEAIPHTNWLTSLVDSLFGTAGHEPGGARGH